MSRLTLVLSGVAVLAFVMLVAGCGSSENVSSEPTATPAGSGAHDDHADHDHGERQEDAGHDQHAPPAEYAEALAELSMEDRMAALKQKTCPVSGGALGAMGKPYKVNVKDRDVFLCCQGCEGAITDDPDKYLAKLSD